MFDQQISISKVPSAGGADVFNIIPFRIRFYEPGKKITIGAGIPRAFLGIDLKYNCHHIPFIQRFLLPELKSIFTGLEKPSDYELLAHGTIQFACEQISKGFEFGLSQKVGSETTTALLRKMPFLKSLRVVECSYTSAVPVLMFALRKILILIDEVFKLTGQWSEADPYKSIFDKIKYATDLVPQTLPETQDSLHKPKKWESGNTVIEGQIQIFGVNTRLSPTLFYAYLIVFANLVFAYFLSMVMAKNESSV